MRSSGGLGGLPRPRLGWSILASLAEFPNHQKKVAKCDLLNHTKCTNPPNCTQQFKALDSDYFKDLRMTPNSQSFVASTTWRIARAVAALLFVVGFSSAATAGEVEDRIKAAVTANTRGKVTADQVTASPVAGVYEVLSGSDIFYVDSTGRYGFVDGRLVDLQQSRDLTAARLDQLTRVDFQKLPLDLAIKEVRGNGRRVLAVFEDPGCPVCRSLHKFMSQLPDVTIYHFVYPVTDPRSVPKSRVVWCSGNRAAAWQAAMRGGEVQGSGNCDVSGIQRIVNLGEELKLQGTPVVLLANGKRLVGATPPDQFLADLDESTSQVAMRR